MSRILGRSDVQAKASPWWRLPVRCLALAAVAMTLGISGGGAWAYFTSTGSGTGRATVGRAVNVTITGTAGTADLLPGGTGAVYFTLDNSTGSLGASFNQMASGATVVSNDTTDCPNGNVSIAQTLPYTFSPAVTVAANTTSATKSIANLIQLAVDAPNTCQGVTFTVTLTLSGHTT